MKNLKCQILNEICKMASANTSNIKCQMSAQVSRSCELPHDLVRSQTMLIRPAHRVYTDIQYFLNPATDRAVF